MHKSIIAFREKMRDEAIDKARKYLDSLNIKVYRSILFGSFARGDFNYGSDIDLLIVSDELPEDMNDRIYFLNSKRWFIPEVEPIGWIVKEYESRKVKNDPFIMVLENEGFDLSKTDFVEISVSQ